MALGNLQSVIEKLRKTIEAHRGYLAENETRTRQVLIDPLLRKLGWDVSNPNIVQLEYRVEQGRPDYALMSKGKPLAVVEAKRLGSDLGDDQIIQALTYAVAAAISYMIVTDGDKWEMYNVFEKVPWKKRLLMKLELSQQPAHKNASQAWAMRKPNLTAKKPGFEPPNPAPDQPKSQPHEQQRMELTNDPPTDLEKCYTLTSERRYPRYTKPTRLKIGDYIEGPVKHWREVIHKIVVWLVDEERLKNNHCPIEIGKWTFVSSEAVNRDGTPFKDPRQLSKGFILQRGLTTEEQWSGLRKMLDQLSVDLSTIQVFYRSTGKANR